MKPSEPSFAEKFRHHDPLRFPLRLSVLCDKNCDCSVPSALQHVWIPGSQCRSNVGRIKDRSDAAPAVCWCIHVYHSGLVDTEQRRGFKIDGSTNDGMPTQARALHPGLNDGGSYGPSCLYCSLEDSTIPQRESARTSLQPGGRSKSG